MEASVLISSTSFYIISSVLGKTMFIQSISDTSRKILDKIENGICYNNKAMEDMYIETDIIATITTLQSLVSEITSASSSSLTMALNNLNTIIIEIHDLLYSIEEKYKEHAGKYMNYFRSINIRREISLICQKSKILEKRLNLLIKIMQITQFTKYSAFRSLPKMIE